MIHIKSLAKIQMRITAYIYNIDAILCVLIDCIDFINKIYMAEILLSLKIVCLCFIIQM